MNLSRCLLLIVSSPLLLPSGARAAGELPPRDVVIRAGKVITVSGEDIDRGVVVIKDGRFAAVGGPDLAVPENLPVIDATTRVLMPGFLELNSQRGLDRTYETAANASFVRITDAMNPASLEIEDARRNGLTTLLVAPSDRAFMAGRCAILHPQGLLTDSMIVKQDAALKISLEPGPGESRMGRLAKLRALLDETRRFLADRERKGYRAESARGRPATREEAAREALIDLLQGRLPALIHCASSADVSAALGLGREYGFHFTPVLAPGTWRAAKLLAANALDCVLTPQVEGWERQADGQVLRIELPRVLSEAGVSFALSTDPYDASAQHPWHQAALAARSGVPRARALAAITSVPARMMGFAGRKGVIAKGADADFLLMSADPLSGAAFVEESYVRGTRIYAREADEKLARLRSRTSEPPLSVAEPDHHDDDERPVEPAGEAPPSISRDPAERRNGWPFAWGPR